MASASRFAILALSVVAASSSPDACSAEGIRDSEITSLLQRVQRDDDASLETQRASGTFSYKAIQTVWSDKFPLCARVAPPAKNWESPINIAVDGVHYPTLSVSEPPKFTVTNGGCKDVEFVSSAGAWQVNFKCENLGMEWKGRTYRLAQFHFHTQSEDSFDFERLPMQMHMVHVAVATKDLPIAFAVIGVQVEVDKNCARHNHFLKSVFETGFPSDIGKKHVESKLPFNPYAGVLSPKGEFWYYPGSLTTPPCTPGVDFLIAEKRASIGPEIVAEYRRYLSTGDRIGDSYGHNARPIQPLNDRPIQAGHFGRIAYEEGEAKRGSQLSDEWAAAFKLAEDV
mmetsp:Transcript_88382/g.255045  ORF Transcript_88382/g.255045 Transcript_88382/m.255045 type:complete len:341 (-) Transcript_88382:156-1178(-)